MKPTRLRIEASSACQLRCPLCPTTTRENRAVIGRGFLRPSDFVRLLDGNPEVREVELANFGEALLNPDLAVILRLAGERGVSTTFETGVNMNHVLADVLEAMVMYGTRLVRIAVDGVTKDSYARYRRRGDLSRVLRNVRALNAAKRKHDRVTPHLVMQFVVFGHNEHEIERARLLARMLDMQLDLRLNVTPAAFPVSDRDHVRAQLGDADRDEFLARTGRHYARNSCYAMWHDPQINWDGKVLGCGRNIWGDYGNAFETPLAAVLMGEKMQYARDMLRGARPPREDMPCLRCSVFRSMQASRTWIEAPELEAARPAPVESVPARR